MSPVSERFLNVSVSDDVFKEIKPQYASSYSE